MNDALWRGSFGHDYTRRNAGSPLYEKRGPFWESFIDRYRPISVLEVGCGIGGNLQHIDAPTLAGFDVNYRAIDVASEYGDTWWGSVIDIPASDLRFAMVFSCGVLIHVAPADVDTAIREMFRVSSKYVALMEYQADEEIAIPYHGQEAALWKRPWEKIVKRVMGRDPVEHRFLGPEHGFDNLDLWVFEK